MKAYFKFLTLPFLLAFFVFISGQSPNQGGDIKAGLAKIKITPQEPVRMAGYGARTEPFKDVHDDLFASAVVFDDGSRRACIITADVIGFSHEFSDDTRKLIHQSTGIAEDHILISAVHNHGGPVTRAYGEELSSNEKAYLAFLKNSLVSVTKDAIESLEPVTLGTGVGTCRMNINRRGIHAEGGIWLGRNPDGPCDHDVAVLRIDDLSSNLRGVLVNWPCHAVVGGQDNYSITGDWPGAAARELENSNQNVVIAMSAGASADINPVYGPNTRFGDIQAIGRILAEEVNQVLENTESYPQRGIEMVHKYVKVPGKKGSESRMPNVSLEPGPEVELRMSSLKIGNILFLGISGELMTEIGMQIKEDSPYKNTFILTHCNGSNGYLVTDKSYEEGGYEPMVSRTMPGTEKIIKDTFRQMNNSL